MLNEEIKIIKNISNIEDRLKELFEVYFVKLHPKWPSWGTEYCKTCGTYQVSNSFSEGGEDNFGAIISTNLVSTGLSFLLSSGLNSITRSKVKSWTECICCKRQTVISIQDIYDDWLIKTPDSEIKCLRVQLIIIEKKEKRIEKKEKRIEKAKRFKFFIYFLVVIVIFSLSCFALKEIKTAWAINRTESKREEERQKDKQKQIQALQEDYDLANKICKRSYRNVKSLRLVVSGCLVAIKNSPREYDAAKDYTSSLKKKLLEVKLEISNCCKSIDSATLEWLDSLGVEELPKSILSKSSNHFLTLKKTKVQLEVRLEKEIPLRYLNVRQRLKRKYSVYKLDLRSARQEYNSVRKNRAWIERYLREIKLGY